MVPFVSGEPKQFREHTKTRFTAVENDFPGLGIVDVVVVGGLEQPDMLFDQENVAFEYVTTYGGFDASRFGICMVFS